MLDAAVQPVTGGRWRVRHAARTKNARKDKSQDKAVEVRKCTIVDALPAMMPVLPKKKCASTVVEFAISRGRCRLDLLLSGGPIDDAPLG